MLSVTFFLGTVSAFATAVYLILFKKQKYNSLICILWSYIFLFILLLVCFYVRNFYLGITLSDATLLFKTVITENIPFYVANALSTLVITVLYAYAFTHYPVSQLIPIVQLGMIFVTAGYYFLGTPLSLGILIGIFLISIGAIISGFERFYFPNVLKPFTEISYPTYLVGLTIMCFDSLAQIIIFLTTYKDYQTFHIQHLFSHMKGLSHFRFAFTSALEYYEGSLPLFILLLFLYLLLVKRSSLTTMFEVLKKNFSLIIGLTIANFFANYVYLYAYQITTAKSFLLALTQFSIPLTLVLAYLHLHEKITFPQKVGAVLIVLGGIVGTF